MLAILLICPWIGFAVVLVLGRFFDFDLVEGLLTAYALGFVCFAATIPFGMRSRKPPRRGSRTPAPRLIPPDNRRDRTRAARAVSRITAPDRRKDAHRARWTRRKVPGAPGREHPLRGRRLAA